MKDNGKIDRVINTVNPWSKEPETFIKAKFVKRPNRFLIRCINNHLGEISAHLPNPGRLWELLLPGAIVYLRQAAPSSHKNASVRKTQHTAMAVERDGSPVFLHTHETNQVARYLIDNDLIAPLKGAKVIKAEVPVGRSRFDFLLQKRQKNIYLEVKSCTLFGNGVAMFPDAVTGRGRRHLLELAEMAAEGKQTAILFLVHSSRIKWFMPDYHTDLAFSKTLLDARKTVQIIPAALGWQKDLMLDERVVVPKIPWTYLKKEINDRGSYLLLIRLARDKHIAVGSLDNLLFRKGYYLYVGSALRHLTARLNRHQRKDKKTHWHIDYLIQKAERIVPIAVRSSQRMECEIAQAVSKIARAGPTGFGSSDCACITHLFWSKNNPLHLSAFHHMLQRFRMRWPKTKN